jgi:hypothetical protein
MALKSGEIAIGDERATVTTDDLGAAMIAAARDSEGSLQTAYDDAIRSSSTDMHRRVVHAASLLPGHEFSGITGARCGRAPDAHHDHSREEHCGPPPPTAGARQETGDLRFPSMR